MTHGYGLNHFQARFMDIKSDDGNSARKVFSRSEESSENSPKVERKRPRESDDKRTVFFISNRSAPRQTVTGVSRNDLENSTHRTIVGVQLLNHRSLKCPEVLQPIQIGFRFLLFKKNFAALSEMIDFALLKVSSSNTDLIMPRSFLSLVYGI